MPFFNSFSYVIQDSEPDPQINRVEITTQLTEEVRLAFNKRAKIMGEGNSWGKKVTT